LPPPAGLKARQAVVFSEIPAFLGFWGYGYFVNAAFRAAIHE
jgi:hypothetical protein